MNRAIKYSVLVITVLIVLSAAVCSCSSRDNTSTIPEHKHEMTEKPVYDPDAVCSIYIYMCGSNLESKRGLAGKDIGELLEAEIPERVNVVIETGGAAEWHSYGIASDRLQRYIVRDHALVLVDELENQSMGDVDTFIDFLDWGKAAYPAERNVVIVWDHGGDATKGVCYDENYGYRGLKQSDFRYMNNHDETAASYANEKMDMVIFDTCLMGNIETASWLQDYFHYMIASEVIVPAGGLNYRIIAEEFAKNDDVSFGKRVCDSFMEHCREKGQEDVSQLSLLDLAETDGVLNGLEGLYADNIDHMEKSDDAITESEYGDAFLVAFSAEMDATIENGQSYNSVDIYNHADTIDWGSVDNADVVREALGRMVVYYVGNVTIRPFPDFDPEFTRDLCHGISMYFPLKFDKSELSEYISICPVEKYAELLDKLYMHVPDVSLEFVDRGSINAEGQVEVQLSEESADYLKQVSGKIWKLRKKDDNYVMIGTQTINIADLNDMRLTLPFTGEWYYLGGQRLYAEVEQIGSRKHLTAPIMLNGESAEYDVFYSYDSEGRPVFEEGTVGTHFDEDGLVQRVTQFRPLKAGDSVRAETEDVYEKIEAFTVESDDIRTEMRMLEPGTYRVQIIAVDFNNNYISSDYALYQVSENGVKALGVSREK